MANGLARVAAVAAALICSGLSISPASAASLVQISGFGANPSNMEMHVYAPDVRVSRPPILVALHWCTGTGPVFFANTEYRSLADRYGFIVVYPTATRSSHCFDVGSAQALTRGGGSDPVGIMSMVTYVIQTYGADSTRVYATGHSSGAMMTNVMLGVYPDVFKAGSAMAGVPFACFANPDSSGWNSTCANGQIIRTPQQWGTLVRNAFPGYTGPRPRMQLIHGTADDVLRYANFGEEIKQWTNVLGVSQTPSSTDTPQSGWTRTRYGGTGVTAPVEGISMQGAPHNLPLPEDLAIAFFGLNVGTPGPGPTPDTQAPSAPANLASGSQTSSSIALSWTASTDNVGVTGYQILRAPGTSGGTFAQIATAATNSFVDAGLAASSTFRYQVRARDAAGNTSAVSNTASATTRAGGVPGGGCSVAAVVQTQWQDGYVVQPVTVTNTGTASINSWTVTFTLPAGHAVTGSWNAVLTSSGQSVTARNAAHNGMLAPNTNTNFGFQVRRPSGNAQVPTAFTCTSP